MHAIPGLRMAVGVVPSRRCGRRHRAGNRRRPLCHRQDGIHPAARRSAAALRQTAVLARRGAVRLQCAAIGARVFATGDAELFSCVLARSATAHASRAATPIRLDRIRENAGDGRHPGQSVHLSPRRGERQQRAHHAIGRRVGGVLPRQALVGDAAARPRQAQAHGRVRRDSALSP